jgi:hypothetical protein
MKHMRFSNAQLRTDQREVRLIEEDRVVGLGAGGQY